MGGVNTKQAHQMGEVNTKQAQQNAFLAKRRTSPILKRPPNLVPKKCSQC